jgi:hypothetical protein
MSVPFGGVLARARGAAFAHPLPPVFVWGAGAAAILLGGCGSASTTTASTPETALERAQLVRVCDGLRTLELDTSQEVAAARAVWPSLAGGLPPSPTPALRGAVARASAAAAALPEPPFAASASKLTGPAAGIAGLYEGYERLTRRAWRLTDATLSTIASAPPPDASFARRNSSLYIDSIYDSHYNLSLLGKSLTSAYERLGGPQAFGGSLTRGEISALAAAYSIPAVRLQPHPTAAGE